MKIENLSREILNDVQSDILDRIVAKGAQVYLVGGCLRNYFLRAPITDIDVEVTGLSFDLLKKILKAECRFVNETFKVITTTAHMDISLPRTEIKQGLGYHEYQLSFEAINIEDTIRRRDFTINALLYDYNQAVLIDLCHGQADIRNRVLRVVDESKYREDSIRVLRLLKFAFTYDLTISLSCRKLNIGLSQYLWSQPPLLCIRLFKSIIASPYFDIDTFLFYLEDFLQLKRLKTCLSHNVFHPEISLYNHVKGCLIALRLFKAQLETRDYYLLFITLLFHDYGKLEIKKGHELLSLEFFQQYQPFLLNNKKQSALTERLISDHMVIREYADNDDVKAMQALRRRYQNQFYLLVIVGLCDYAGRVIDFNIETIKTRMSWYQAHVLNKYQVNLKVLGD